MNFKFFTNKYNLSRYEQCILKFKKLVKIGFQNSFLKKAPFNVFIDDCFVNILSKNTTNNSNKNSDLQQIALGETIQENKPVLKAIRAILK